MYLVIMEKKILEDFCLYNINVVVKVLKQIKVF